MSKLLELISDMQDYGYDITTDRKVSNKTLADYLVFHMDSDKENPKFPFTDGEESMRKDVLKMLNNMKGRVYPAHVYLVDEIIIMVKRL